MDSDLWTSLFKNIHDYPRRRAILFSSYGSPSRFITGRGSRFCVEYSQMVTLRAVQHQDDFPATGLLFSRVEFDDLISKDKYLFDSSFFNEVFNASGGHLGAVKAFLSVITAHDVSLCCVTVTELVGDLTLYFSRIRFSSTSPSPTNNTPTNFSWKKSVYVNSWTCFIPHQSLKGACLRRAISKIWPQHVFSPLSFVTVS